MYGGAGIAGDLRRFLASQLVLVNPSSSPRPRARCSEGRTLCRDRLTVSAFCRQTGMSLWCTSRWSLWSTSTL